MSRLPHFAIFSFAAAVHLLLFSVCPVASRIYQTNDAVVIEVDAIGKPESAFVNRNFGNYPRIPMMDAVNPVSPYTGLYYQQQPNFLFWPYPLYRPAASSFSDDVKKDAATYSPESKQQQNIACGKGPTPSLPILQPPAVRVIGGTDVIKNPWPFMVGLKTVPRFSTFCGGTLISTTKILTAASCVNKFSAYEISEMTARFGMINQRGQNPNQYDDAQQVRRVTRVVYHLDYNDKTKQNDIAILTIDPPITYSSAISPVCLPKSNTNVNQLTGQNAGILGWGYVSNSDPGSKLPLQQATVQVIANADCNASYKTANTSITAKQFCTAANTGAIASACQYDDGGPLVTQNQQTSAWTQAGVYSFGSGCTNPATPSVYTSVAYFRNWIDTYMKN